MYIINMFNLVKFEQVMMKSLYFIASWNVDLSLRLPHDHGTWNITRYKVWRVTVMYCSKYDCVKEVREFQINNAYSVVNVRAL